MLLYLYISCQLYQQRMLTRADNRVSPQIKMTSSRLQLTCKGGNAKTTKIREMLVNVLTQLNKMRMDMSQLKDTTKGLDGLKRVVCNNIISTSFEYERYANDIKFKLEDSQQNLAKMIKVMEQKQLKAAQMLSEKLDEIQQLNQQLSSISSQNESVKKSKKVQEDVLNKTKSQYEQQISDLNLKINDLLAIVHQKSQRIQTLQNQSRKSTARIPLASIFEENNSNKASSRISHYHSFSTDGEVKGELGKSHARRASGLRISSQLTSQELPIFTMPKQEVIKQNYHRQRNSDNEILAKLQKFVSDLTTSQNNSVFLKTTELTKNENIEELKITPRLEWSQTLRRNEHRRRNSSQFMNRK